MLGELEVEVVLLLAQAPTGRVPPEGADFAPDTAFFIRLVFGGSFSTFWAHGSVRFLWVLVFLRVPSLGCRSSPRHQPCREKPWRLKTGLVQQGQPGAELGQVPREVLILRETAVDNMSIGPPGR